MSCGIKSALFSVKGIYFLLSRLRDICQVWQSYICAIQSCTELNFSLNTSAFMYRLTIFLLLLTISVVGCNQFTSADKKVSIEGLITKGFEIYELKTKSGEILHVFDPQQHLKPIIAEGFKNQSGETLWLTIPVCIDGLLSPKGQYGHMGSYIQQIEIIGLCT